MKRLKVTILLLSILFALMAQEIPSEDGDRCEPVCVTETVYFYVFPISIPIGTVTTCTPPPNC